MVKYSDGSMKSAGQLAVAMFPNEGGLMKTGNGNYTATNTTGILALGASGQNGAGYVDWDFAWKNDNVIIVSSKRGGFETLPEKGHYHLYMRLIVQAMYSIESQSHLISRVIIIQSL